VVAEDIFKGGEEEEEEEKRRRRREVSCFALSHSEK